MLYHGPATGSLSDAASQDRPIRFPMGVGVHAGRAGHGAIPCGRARRSETAARALPALPPRHRASAGTARHRDREGRLQRPFHHQWRAVLGQGAGVRERLARGRAGAAAERRDPRLLHGRPRLQRDAAAGLRNVVRRQPVLVSAEPHAANPANETVRIRRARDEPADTEALADVLIDCVEGGASVSFMHPLPRAKAIGFWRQVLASAARGERIVLVAEDAQSGAVVGTVQVVPATPENQPHRADVAKTLLVLDTVTGGDAERLYARLGWQRCGEIPGYALWPRGGLCSTTLFYRVLT